MTWVSLVITILKVVSSIMDYVNREKLIQSGRDEEIAKITAAILQKTAAGKAIMERVNALSDADVDAELRGLEPK